MHLERLPRFPLAHLPTPVEKLERLSRELGGLRLLIKRDDQTGLALGGNKTRKLEFLVGQALDQGADTLVTAGAAQSNHCRQTAAAAARAGLRCELILSGAKPELPNGNLLLNQLLGAHEHWIARAQLRAKRDALLESLRAEGRRPYFIPIGGSNGVGACGYVMAMFELMEQLRASDQTVDRILFGTSSGGTQAGVVVGARLAGFTGKLLGLSIDKDEPEHLDYETEVARIANECAESLGSAERFDRTEIEVAYGYKGEGYGVVGALEREAIALMARHQGILLDPVYTGRAFGAFLAMCRQRAFPPGERILFWHTGGAPALFAYAQDLVGAAQ